MTTTDRPTREDALNALDKLYRLIKEGNYMLAENPRNVLEAYIENAIVIDRVIDRDRVPQGLKGAIEFYRRVANETPSDSHIRVLMQAAALLAEKSEG